MSQYFNTHKCVLDWWCNLIEYDYAVFPCYCNKRVNIQGKKKNLILLNHNNEARPIPQLKFWFSIEYQNNISAPVSECK